MLLSKKEPALRVRGLGKSIDLGERSLQILQGIDLEIKQGESLAIVGRSGSGKTTLLGLMAGLDLPSEGQVELMGESLDQMDEDQRALVRSKHVGFVFQSFHLLPGMTALENVMLPLELQKAEDAREQALKLLTSLGLAERLDQFPPQLSGGEQQRVALARAVVSGPTILFADEPTGNLDSQTGKEIIDLLFEVNRTRNTTLVLVTHDNALASLCERQALIEDGCLIEQRHQRAAS
ncbi:MAG: ABC transporter [Oleiphilus sp.]|nr:MAG: ABC transporter [Oleiphilus sp.]